MKVISAENLNQIRAQHSTAKIVHCHGVFDVLHAGHLSYFRSAKKFGDILVVTVTDDPFVNKGPGRPFFNSKVRSGMVAALELIDYVAINNAPTAVPAIQALRPDFYVKGPDYKDKARDASGAIYEEEKAVVAGGGELVFTDDETHSSSELVNKYFQPWNEEQQKMIATVKKAGGLPVIEEVLDRMSKQSVVVIGEPIVDTYIFCQPENISSKSPSISARFSYEENYAGGALAIANHLADFAQSTKILFTHGGEPYFHKLLTERMDERVQIESQEIRSLPTPRKTRYITIQGAQRLFEITDLRSDQWTHHSPIEFNRMILKANHKDDTTIVADFGHGLFENTVLNASSDLVGFKALNVQTNSSNFGFNPFTKHRRFDYLSIDTREVRVAYHDRLSSVPALTGRLRKDLRRLGANASMTLGSLGASYFSCLTDREYIAPAFADSVVDATGAGDAYFAITSMLVKADCPQELIPFVGNVFAGLKTKIMGNKSAVSRAQLIKAVTAILK